MYPSSDRPVVISRALDDLGTPGVVIQFDPDAADSLGAFVDDALDADEAQPGDAA